MKKVYVISALNGAGLTSSRFVFEELGYHIIENVPESLTKSLLDELSKSEFDRIVLAVDVKDMGHVYTICHEHKDFETRSILLGAEKYILLQRFALTRHIHPRTINSTLTLEQAIDLDIELSKKLVEKVDLYVDTSSLTVGQLRKYLYHFVAGDKAYQTSITFISYGLKYGVPQGLDCSFDVRSIPNPFWVDELKEKTGADKEVIDYLLSYPETMKCINNIINYLDNFLPNVIKKERANYNIGIACSGGCHRSTFVANYLADHYKDKYNTIALHRNSPDLNNER